MQVQEACEKSAELNQHGNYREAWFYYPLWLPSGKFNSQWAVARRPKTAQIKIAMFGTGKLSIFEEQCPENLQS